MMKEYNNSYTEYAESSDLQQPKEHMDYVAYEYFAASDEYWDSGNEYSDNISPKVVLLTASTAVEEKKKKQKRHAKLVQKMAYAVASVATVAMLTQAAEPDKVVQGSFLDEISPADYIESELIINDDTTGTEGSDGTSGEDAQGTAKPTGESIAGVTIVFSGDGELTKEVVQKKLEGYEIDGSFQVVIEEGITGIGDSAFNNYKDLVSVVIPDGVTEIGYYAFAGCEKLTEVEIPASVIRIGQGAFGGCKNLVLEKFTTKGRTMGGDVFSEVTIGEVEISESFELDSTYVFQFANVEKVSFETGITKIPASALNNCDTITEIIIPQSVTEIGNYAFAGCEKLTLIVPSDSAAETYAIDNNIPYRTY